jgi:H+/Cl- antiporter ClcA
MSDNNYTSDILSKWNTFRIRIIFQGMLVGGLTGILIVIYRILAESALEFCSNTYIYLREYPFLIPLWLLILTLMGIFIGYLVEKEPMISGSGIPQVEGVLLRKLKLNWFKVLVFKFVGGIVSLGGGLSVGREGPSIQMGAVLADGYCELTKRPKIKKNFLITAGASAGLAASFNAPLAGVIFALEEVHKNFSPIVLTTTLAASITSSFVAGNFFGMKPIFHVDIKETIPLRSYPYLIILGVILGVTGILFNKGLLKTQDLYSKQRFLQKKYWPIIPFLLACLLGFFIPEVLGGGHTLIDLLLNSNSFSLVFLFELVIIKYVFTVICYGSTSPGGIFLPLLAIGALIGAIYASIIIKYFGFNESYLSNIIIIAMAGYFTSIVKAPITGMILLTEMTGSFSHLLSIAVVSIIAYIIAELLNSKPIYESLFERLIPTSKNTFHGESKNKVILEIPICLESKLQNKMISEINWPANCLIAAIKRGDDEIIPKGDTIMYASDYLIVLTNEDTASNINDCLCEYGGVTQF